MKKSAFIILTALLIFSLQAQGQIRAGIRAGVNAATWGGDAVASFSEIMESSGAMEMQLKPDFHVGAYLRLPLSNALSLEPGIYYSGKGAQVSQTFFSNSLIQPKATITNNSHYVEVPLLLRLHMGPGFQLYAGPQVGYLVDNRIKAEAGVFGASYEYNTQADPGFRKFDFGLAGGLGYEFAGGVNLQAGYEWGLSTLDEGNSNIDAYNRVVKVSLGYTFGR